MKQKKKISRKVISIVLAIVMAISTFTVFVPGTCLKVQAEGTTYSPASEYNDYGTLNSNNTTVQIEGVKIGDAIVDWYVIGYDSTDKTVTLLSKQSFASKQFNSDLSKGHDYVGSDIEAYVKGLIGDGQPLAGIKDALADISGKVTGAPDTISGAVPYLLSTTEAGWLSETKKKSGNDWWLRSPGTSTVDSCRAALVIGTGMMSGMIGSAGYNVDIQAGVRPALKLNLSKVSFNENTKTFEKPSPDVGDFNYTAPTDDLTYDGNPKTASIAIKQGISGMGDVTVKYYSDQTRETEVTNPTDAGTYYVGITVTEGTNYKATSSVLYGNDWKFTIAPKPVKVTGITASNKVYDGNTNATLDTSDAQLDGLISGDELTVSATGTFDNKEVGTGKTVTISNISFDGSSANNYTPSSESQTTATADITPKSLTITAEAKAKIYGGADPALTYTTDGLVEGDTINGALLREEGETVGTYAINKGTLDAGSNYSMTYNGADFTISKKVLNITAEPKSKTYGDSDPELTYNVEGLVGEDMAASVLEGALKRVAGEDVAVYAIGQGTLTSKNNNYGINYTGANFTIEPKEVELSWGETAFTYNGTYQKPVAEATGLVDNDTCTVTVEGAQKDANVNLGEETYTATATSLSNPNYKLPADRTTTFTIAQKEVGLEWDKDSFTFNGTAQQPAATATGLAEGDTCNVEVSVSGEHTNAGNYSAVAGSLSDANYKLSADVNYGYVINKKEITASDFVIGSSDGLDPGHYVHTGNVIAPTITASSRLIESNDPVSLHKDTDYVLTRELTASTTGSHIIKFEGSGNYTGEGYLVWYIDRQTITVTAEDKSKTYGDDDPELTVKITTAGGTVIAEDEAGIEYSIERVSGENAGEYAINVTGAAAQGDYKINYVSGKLTIGKAAAVVKTDKKTKFYGDEDPQLSAKVTGLKNGDTADVITYTLNRAAGENTGSYTITPSGEAVQGNYNVTFEPNELTIKKRSLSESFVRLKQVSFKHDGQMHSPEVVFDGFTVTKGRDYTVSGETSANDKGVHSVTVSGIGQNFTGSVTLQWFITGVGDSTVTYDAVPHSLEADEDAGQVLYKQENGSYTGEAPSYTDAGRYSYEYKTVVDNPMYGYIPDQPETIEVEGTAVLTIEPATLTVTADNKTKTYGDADPEFTFTETGYVGGQTRADVFTNTTLSRDEGEDFGTYAITKGQLAVNGNYTIDFHPGNLTITKKTPAANCFTLKLKSGETEAGLNGNTVAYSGEEWSVEASSATGISGLGNITVHYYKVEGDAEPSELTVGEKPKNAGKYIIKLEVAEGDNYSASPELMTKESWTFEITKASETAPNADTTNLNISYSAETISAKEGYEVASDNNGTLITDGFPAILNGDNPTVYVRKAGSDENHVPSDWVAVTLPARPATPAGLATVNATNGSTPDGKITGTTAEMEYSEDNGTTWTSAAAGETSVKPGTYQVRVRATETAPHGKVATVTVGSNEIILTDSQKPTAKTNLVYNGSEQSLLNAPAADLPYGATGLQYAIGTDASTAPTSGWGTFIPKKTDAGTYYVWYMVKGDDTHSDSVPACITVNIAIGEPSVREVLTNAIDYTTGKFKESEKYEIFVGTSAPVATDQATGIPEGGYDLLENIVDVNHDQDTDNDKKLYVRIKNESETSAWVYIPLPERQSTDGITVDYNKDTLTGVYTGIKYSTNGSDPETGWTDTDSSDLTKSPVNWNGTAETLKFQVPGNQDKQLFPSMVKEITLGAKDDAPTEDDLNGYPVEGDNIKPRSANLPTPKNEGVTLQYRYRKNPEGTWTSWGSSNKAIGLEMGTKYDYEVRFAPGKDEHGNPTPASKTFPASPGTASFTTKMIKPDADEFLNEHVDYSKTPAQYTGDNGVFEYSTSETGEPAVVFSNNDEIPNTTSGFYIRYKDTDKDTEGDSPSEWVFIPTRNLPADIEGVNKEDELISGAGGTFTGTDETMEYRYRKTGTDEWSDWMPCTSGMTGMSAGEYQIRKKGTGSELPSFAKHLTIAGSTTTATIAVTVEDSEHSPVTGAKVQATLVGGATVTGIADAGNDGKYNITGLSAGTYLIVVTGTDGHQVTTLVDVKEANHTVTLILPTGRENSSKLVDNTGNNIAVGGIDDQAAALDQSEPQKEYLITFKAEEKSEDASDDATSTAITGIKARVESESTYKDLEGNSVDVQKEFVDFTVEKMLLSNAGGTGGEVGYTEKISETSRVMEIAYPYPMINSRFGIIVWRYHDNAVKKFTRLASRPISTGSMKDATYFIDRLEKRLYIYGNLFSTYSITYTENADIKDPDTGNPGGGGTGGGGGGTPTPSYTPAITKPEHGTITVNPASPQSGQNAVVTVTPEEGYETEDVIVKDKDSNTVPVTKNTDGTYTFTQPSTGPVTIEAVVKQSTDLTPTIKKPEHGTISANPAKPKAGEPAIVTVTPDEGYEVDSFIVTDKEGKPVAFTLNEDGTYSFIQPESGCVTIEAVLRLKGGVIVRFDLNDRTGTEPDPQTFAKGGKAVRPNDPAVEGYKFTDWYTEKECKNVYDFDTPVNEDLILYAGWDKTGPGPDDNDFGIYFTELFDDPYDGVHYNAKEDRYEIVYTGTNIKPLIRVTSKADGVLKEGIDYSVSYSNNKNVSKPNKPATIRVNGKEFYKSKKVLELYILWADLEEANSKGLLAGADEFKVLNGNKLNPMIVYRGYKLAGRDRDISNKDKITGDTTTDVTGRGNFTGTLKDVPVKVISKDDQKNGAIKVNLKAAKHVYNGKAHKLSITTADAVGELTVTAGSSKTPLIEDTDFVVSYSGNTLAGKATVTITGIGKCNGTVVKNFTIQPDKTIDITAELADPAPVNFNVRGAQPDIKVTAHRKAEGEKVTDEVLVEGRDYKVSYSSNKKIGKGSFTVKFTGNYNGHKAVKGTFDIVQASISTAKVEAMQMIYKNPGKYLSKPFVSIDGVQLKTSDYTYKYYLGDEEITSRYKLALADDETSKTVRIVVTGKGNYTDTTAEGTYEVVRRGAESIDLTKAKIVAKDKVKGKDVSVAKQEYNGYAIEPEIRVMVRMNKKWVDVDPADYTVSYINNVNKGTATILVSGNGNETIGSKTARFSINTMRFELFRLIFGK